ncbi:MAG: virulence RhuM family protein [Planctomycetaceae bacterium]|nr:virulence RhuM family protein [Planctomycetaceae bacterium]
MTNDDKNRQFLLYTAPDGDVRVEVIFQDETVWLTQKSLAELFGVDRSVVSKHLKNIFDSGELAENSVCAKIAHTAADGKTYSTQYYNLDATIAVGYRVNSYQATQFRIWAMSEWVVFLHRFLELSDYPILFDSGKVTALEAKLKAEAEYDVFRKRQDKEYISDFDREIKRLLGTEPPSEPQS